MLKLCNTTQIDTMSKKNKGLTFCILCILCATVTFLPGCGNDTDTDETSESTVTVEDIRPEEVNVDITEEDPEELLNMLPPKERARLEAQLAAAAAAKTATVAKVAKEEETEKDPLEDIPVRFQPNEEVKELVNKAMMALRMDVSDEEKLALIEELDGIDHPIVLEVVELALDEPNAEIREAALDAIMEINDPAVVPVVTKALSDEDPDLREYSLDALMDVDDERVNAPLMKALDDEVLAVAENAVDIMLYIESPNIIPSLSKAIENPNEDIWETALLTIEDIPDKRTVDVIIEKGLLSENETLREDAMDSLMFLTDEEFETYQEWRQWWDRNRDTYEFDW